MLTAWMVQLFQVQADDAFAQKDARRLRASAERLLADDPFNDTLWERVAETYLQTQQWCNAFDWTQRWQTQTSSLHTLMMFARIDMSIGLLHRAARQLTSAIQQQDEHASALQLLAQIEQALGHEDIDEYDACLIALERASNCQDLAAVELIARHLLSLGQTTNEMMQYAGLACFANQHYEQVLQLFANQTISESECLLAVTESLLRVGGAPKAESLLVNHFGPGPYTDPRLIAQRFAIAVARGDHEASWTWLRGATDHVVALPIFYEAAEQWIGELVSVVELGEWFARQKNRFNNVAHFWSLYAFIDFRRGSSFSTIRHHYLNALKIAPNDAVTLAKIATTYAEEHVDDQAHQYYQHALQIDPYLTQAWHEWALLSERKGDFAHAESCFQRLLSLSPNTAAAWSHYGNFCIQKRASQRGVDCAREAVRLAPHQAMCWNNLGAACLHLNLTVEAQAALETALELQPNLGMARSNQIRTQGQFGEFDGVIELFESLPNKDPLACNSLFFCLNYHPNLSIEQIYASYRKTIDRYFPARQYFSYNNEKSTNRKLVIAYVSPDFKQHACFRFIMPLLRHHDHDKFCVIAYSAVDKPDQYTDEIRSQCDHWRDIISWDDRTLAEQIRLDKVDILIDLAGHTRGNRLTMFALKPAPVQISWLGFGYTTGLQQMDYFLTDAIMVPPGSETVLSEVPLRIDAPCFAYEPPTSVPEVAETPAMKKGFVTLGSLSRTIRLNKRCLSVWLSILQRLPNSHLVLNSYSFREPAVIERFSQFFTQQGIAPSRLHIGLNSPPWPVYQRLDIMLDCFPHNSGTTLFEGLLMGVPFITRQDRVSMGRLGATIARGIGHPEWIAESDEDYVQKVIDLASDITALNQLRLGIGTQMLASPLCDAEGFCRRVEHAYSNAWRQYCEQAEAQKVPA